METAIADPRERTVEGFIEGLRILAKHSKDGLKARSFLEAEHDEVYLHLDAEDVPEDSEDGLLLQSLGFFYDANPGCWNWFT